MKTSLACLWPRAAATMFTLSLLLGAGDLRANDNRLQNPGFDAVLSGWVDIGDSVRRSRFSGEDATGQPGSGSIELRQFGSVFAGVTERFRAQCVRLDGMIPPIAYGASARVDLAQSPAVRARLQLWEYANEVCQGVPLSGGADDVVNHGEDAWRTLELVYVPSGPGVVAVSVELAMESLEGGSGGGLRGVLRFDDVFFGGGAGRQPVGYVQRRATIDAGAGHSGDAPWNHGLSVGQPDPGAAAGGGFALQSGFWHAAGISPPPQSAIFANGFE